MRTLPTTDDFADIALGRTAVDGLDALKIRVVAALRHWRNTWFVDPETGVPYLGDIIGRQGAGELPRTILTREVLAVEGVTGIEDVAYSFDSESRQISFGCTILSDTGAADVNAIIEVQ